MGKPPAAKHWEVLRRSGPCCVRICGGRRRRPSRRPGCGRHNLFRCLRQQRARFGIGQDLAVPERRVGAAAAKDRAVLYRVDARVRSHIDADTRGRDEIHTVRDRIPPRHGRMRKLVVFNAERAELQRQLGRRLRLRNEDGRAAGCLQLPGAERIVMIRVRVRAQDTAERVIGAAPLPASARRSRAAGRNSSGTAC